MREFLVELKRRHVYRVAVIYAAVAWLAVQIADVVLENFNLPDRVMQLVILCAALGFPVALILAWLYDLSARGIQRTAARDSVDGAATSVPETPGESGAAGDRRPGIVVLPFASFSAEAFDEVIASGFTEDLTTLLAHVPDIFVISRNTAALYKDRKMDFRDIGRELGVRYLLEGSLRRRKGDLRITAQLIEAGSGAHLWAHNYDAPADRLDQIQDRLTQEIALQLGSELARAEFRLARRRPPADMDAWSLYQSARGTLMFKGWNQSSLRQAIEQLHKAIELDPTYAAPQAYLALLLALGHWTRLVDDLSAAHDESILLADRALELEPDSSEVLGYAGCAYSDLGYKERGVPLLERAIELDASNAQARAALGAALIVTGELDSGIEALSEAVRISPKDPGLALWATILALGTAFSGDIERAEEWSILAFKSDPHFFPCLVVRAWVQLARGEVEAAQTSIDEAGRLYPKLDADYVRDLMGEPVVTRMQAAGLRFKH